MLEINQITFSYGKKKSPVFKDFSLSLKKGSVYGLLGKNGTGKSTLLYLMSGLLRSQDGCVKYKGEDVSFRRPSVLADLYIVPEEFALPNISLKKYVSLNMPFYPKFSEEILGKCLEIFEMDRNIHLGELSMGQKKKAFMCFALATNTSFLLMDEPTNGLDIPSKSQFRKVIASSMNDERCIVISTHQVRDIDSLLDHLVIIDGSDLLLDTSVKNVCERLCFEERPLGETLNDAFYVQPSVHGNSVVCPNVNGIDTPLNLELLFNAFFAERKQMKLVFE